MKILITGANGFIGRNLTRKLTQIGHIVVGVDNGFTSGKSIENLDNYKLIDKHIQEITESDLDGVEILIHLAAVKKHSALDSESEMELFNTNFIATSRLFQLAKTKLVKKIIFASSLYAHGDMHNLYASENDTPLPLTTYGQSKLFGEHQLRALCEDNSIKGVALRLYFIYGPEQFHGKGYPSVFISAFNKLAKGESPLINNDGRQKLDYLYVDDLVELIVNAVEWDSENSFEVVNASSGLSYEIGEIVKIITNEWNINNNTNIIPVLSNITDFTNGTFRSGINKKALDLYKWKPRTSIQSGIKHFLNWFANENQK